MTFSKWAQQCSKSESDKRHLKHLEGVFGEMPVSEIADEYVKKYREKRSTERIIRHGEPSAKIVSQTTINKEVSTLRKFFRLGPQEGLRR